MAETQGLTAADLESFAVRFAAKVAVSDGCWEWRGHRGWDGYGRVKFRGRVIGAHQAALLIFNGSLPPRGMEACHHCDNRPCVRPDHLFLGSRGDNTRDAIRKGRPVVQVINKSKTACLHGHPYSEANTWLYRKSCGDVSRHCRACMRVRARRYSARKRRARKTQGLSP